MTSYQYAETSSKLEIKDFGDADARSAKTSPSQSFDIPQSELEDMNQEKHHAAQKYMRNSREKRMKANTVKNLERDYDSIVDEIRHLRMHNKNASDAVRLLDKHKKRAKKFNSRKAVIQSGTSSTESFGCDLLNRLHSVIKYLQKMRHTIGEKTINFFLDLFTTLYNIYKTPEWSSLILNFTSFCSRYVPTQYVDYAIVWLKSAFEVAFSQDQASPTNRDLILSLFSNSENIINDSLWTNISEFFVKCAALYGAVTDTISLEALDFTTILTHFTKYKSKLPIVQDVIENAFNAYEFVLGHWENIVTGDWSKLLLGKDETQEFEIEVRIIEQAFPFVIANKEVVLLEKFNMTLSQFEVRMTAAIRTAKSLIARCTSKTQKMCVSNFIKSLTDKQSAIYAASADAPRKLEAYAIKFAGPSGSGKSTLLDMCSKVILNSYGFNPNEGGQVVFTNISEKYESTIMPNHKVICADDVANNLNENPNYDRFLNYVNTVPRPLEKAGVNEKGIYFPGNSAFLATTNDETLRVFKCSVCPESILRRFALDVTVDIREEYRNDYGGLKSQEDVNFSVYELTLKRFKSLNYDNVSAKPTINWDIIPRSEWVGSDAVDQDFSKMLAFVAKDVKRHIKRKLIGSPKFIFGLRLGFNRSKLHRIIISIILLQIFCRRLKIDRKYTVLICSR
jgi:energy-coupling factor transporter ATP-binding protein EcfA2